jgi:hypothetical protein
MSTTTRERTDREQRASEAIDRAAAKAFALPAGMTYNNLNDLLASELNEDFGGGASYDLGGGRLWIRDFDDAYVIYEDRDGSLTRRAYTLTAGNDVQWGQPEEVSAQTAYVPMAGAEPQSFASKRHSKSDQEHMDKAVDHMIKAGAMLPDMAAGAVTSMYEAVAVQMTEDANRRSASFTLPQWFTDSVDGSDLPQWIPYLPMPHDFAHPVYGTVSITPERIQNFVTQFNAGVYQKPIGFDTEHDIKGSGAVVWAYEMRVNDDGSADARVEWTKRGEQMYRDGAFKYISPEWYDEWTDPATGQTYQDIAIGGALTTRPFFKAPYLRPLAASEDESRTKPIAGERSTGMTATTETVSPAQFSELSNQFADLKGKFEASETARTAAEAENTTLKTANEALVGRVDTLEKDARTKRFTELVADWPGNPAEHVAVLERFREAFGEDSDPFKAHLSMMNGAAAQLKDAGIFREAGSNASGGGGAAAQLDALAKQMSEKDGIPYAQAYDAVLQQQPKLYAEYEREMRGQ